MNWFCIIFLAQLLFGNVFCIGPVPLAIGASALGAYSYSGHIMNTIIQDYIDEDVEPFNSCELIKNKAVYGDLIEFDRNGLAFNHWAIYTGGGKVGNPLVLENIEYCKYFNDASGFFLRSDMIVVANGSNCRVNNKKLSAKIRGVKAQSIDEVRRLIQMNLRKKFDYNILGFNCEHFVTQIKFGLAFSDQADAVRDMTKQGLKYFENLLRFSCHASSTAFAASLGSVHTIVENWIDEDVGQFLNPELVLQEVELYDIIEIKRGGYSHYAIYIGNGYVQHLSHDYDIFKTVFEKRIGFIVRDKLLDVVGTDSCRVNNKNRSVKRRQLVENDKQTIKIYVDAWVEKKVEYSIFSYNCEHIVTQWKFGKAFSDQVDALNEISKNLTNTAAAYILYAYTGQTFGKHL